MSLVKTIIILCLAIYLKILIKENMDKFISAFTNFLKDIPYFNLIEPYILKYKDVSDGYLILIILVFILILF